MGRATLNNLQALWAGVVRRVYERSAASGDALRYTWPNRLDPKTGQLEFLISDWRALPRLKALRGLIEVTMADIYALEFRVRFICPPMPRHGDRWDIEAYTIEELTR